MMQLQDETDFSVGPRSCSPWRAWRKHYQRRWVRRIL